MPVVNLEVAKKKLPRLSCKKKFWIIFHGRASEPKHVTFSSFNILTNQIEENVNYLQDRERSEKKMSQTIILLALSSTTNYTIHIQWLLDTLQDIFVMLSYKTTRSSLCEMEFQTLGATMWFWIMLRIKEDGPVMFGLKLPFEHH